MKPLVVTITAASVFFFANLSKPSFSIPISHAVEADTLPSENAVENYDDEEEERILQERVDQNPNSIEDLNNLLLFKARHEKFRDAISIVERLEILTSHISPEDTQLLVLKLHFLISAGELEKAKSGFEEILANDPFYVDAYHGLLTVIRASDDLEKIKVETDILVERIKIIAERCKREKRKYDLTGFNLLIGNIMIGEEKYEEAIEFYTKIAKAEPIDFRSYLGRGTAYALMRKKAEAFKQFETYRRLVPQTNNLAEIFDKYLDVLKIFDDEDGEETPKEEETSRR